MILNIRVIPKASRNLIKEDKGGLKAYLTKTPHDGLANKQLIELLSAYLKVRKYEIRIIKGEKSRNKTIEIDDAVNSGK